MKQYGLIGYPLTHSFSEKYFQRKFQDEEIEDCSYQNFELKSITDFPALIKTYPELRGLNVTIPYKEDVIRYLDELDPTASKVGAVNVIRIYPDGKKKGFNSDYYGFRYSLENWLQERITRIRALVLGTGGAARAIKAVLFDCNIEYKVVSRNKDKGDLTYGSFIDDPDLIREFHLIVNTTPLGMHPNRNEAPHLPYDKLDEDYYLYDLIYNPEKTLFLAKGEEAGARIKNGLEMLVLQAEKSWTIWNK